MILYYRWLEVQVFMIVSLTDMFIYMMLFLKKNSLCLWSFKKIIMHNWQLFFAKSCFPNRKMQYDEMIFSSFYLSVHIRAHDKVYAGLTLTNNETQYCWNIRVLHGFLVAVVPFMLHIDTWISSLVAPGM